MFGHVDPAEPPVVVARDGQEWCVTVERRRYRSVFLVRVDRWVRRTLEVTEMAWINYEFRTGDPHVDKLIREARQTRLAVYIAEVQAQESTREALADNFCAAMSQREVGVLLSLSHQRIHQLRAALDAESPIDEVDRSPR